MYICACVFRSVGPGEAVVGLGGEGVLNAAWTIFGVGHFPHP